MKQMGQSQAKQTIQLDGEVTRKCKESKQANCKKQLPSRSVSPSIASTSSSPYQTQPIQRAQERSQSNEISPYQKTGTSLPAIRQPRDLSHQRDNQPDQNPTIVRIRKNRSLQRHKNVGSTSLNNQKDMQSQTNQTISSQLQLTDKQSCSTGHSSAEVSPKSKNRRNDSVASSLFTSTVKEAEPLSYEDFTEEMNMRWLKLIQRNVPTVDLVDVSLEVYPFNSHKRQFAPEYSYCAYLTMLRQEFAIGNYLKNPNCSLQISDYTRLQMVMLIEDLASIKQYKVETLYLAVAISDKYLVNIAVQGKQAPCLITLAVTSLLMGAKIEQPISPSFSRMVNLMQEQHDTLLQKQDLIDLEEKILRQFEFGVHHISPIPFLERFLRIYNVDQAKKTDKHCLQIQKLSRQYCRFMQRSSEFLAYRPSQIAAAGLLFGLNIIMSDVAPAIGIKKIEELQLKSLFFETSIYIEVSGIKIKETDLHCPLRMWNNAVEKLTLVKRDADIKPVYQLLVSSLDRDWYSNQLQQDPKLFFQSEEAPAV